MVAHLLYGIGGTLLIALSLDSSVAKGFFALRPIEWLGRVSYSLYLIHMPLLYLCLWGLYGELPTFMVYLIALAVIALASEASYRWIELPSIGLGRQLTEATSKQMAT